MLPDTSRDAPLRRRPSAWRRRPPPRARAGDRPGRGSCSSTAAAPGSPSSSTRGPCGPETMRIRRYRPRSRRSSRRSSMSLMQRAPLACWHLNHLGERVWRAIGPRRDRRLALVAQLRRRVPEGRLVLAVDQPVDRGLGRVAVEPAGAVVGPRVRAVVGLAGGVQAELLEHRAVVLGLGAERGEEVAHHHAVQPGLDRERLELAEVLDPAAAEAEQRVGEDQPEDRDPLDRLPRVHEVAVAELRARARVQQVDRHAGRVDRRRAGTPSRRAARATRRG